MEHDGLYHLFAWLGGGGFAVVGYFVFKDAVPFLYSIYSGKRKKNLSERENSRTRIKAIADNVAVNATALSRIDKHLEEINGSIQAHHADHKIHASIEELVTAESCNLNVKFISDRLSEAQNRDAKTFEKLFEKIDSLSVQLAKKR